MNAMSAVTKGNVWDLIVQSARGTPKNFRFDMALGCASAREIAVRELEDADRYLRDMAGFMVAQDRSEMRTIRTAQKKLDRMKRDSNVPPNEITALLEAIDRAERRMGVDSRTRVSAALWRRKRAWLSLATIDYQTALTDPHRAGFYEALSELRNAMQANGMLPQEIEASASVSPSDT